MFKEAILAILDNLGNEWDISGNEIKTTCLNPEHDDNNPSFFINTKTGACHCFSCGYTISPKRLFGDSSINGSTKDLDIDELIRTAKYNNLIPQERKREEARFFLPPKAYDIDRDWRGMSRAFLEQLNVYYCDKGRFKGRLVFPIWYGETLKGLDTRIVNPSLAEYHDAKWLRAKHMEVQKLVYPLDYLKQMPVDKRSHVILTEGVADALSYLYCGVAAIPTFGLSSPDNERIETMLNIGVTTVTIGYDNDLKGQEAILRVYPYYKKWFDVRAHPLVTKVRKTGLKDANEALMAGIIKGDIWE